MTSGTTSLIEEIQTGQVTPANAGSRIDKAGGEALVMLEVVRALAEGGGTDPLTLLASQAEAEAGSSNTKLMSPLRTAEAIAELAGSSSPIVTPNVIHVTTAGNDDTGDGTLAKPYLTLGKAHLVAPTGLIHLGVGMFTFAATSDTAIGLTIVGAGIDKTSINLSASTSAQNITLNCNDLEVSQITNTAANGADGMGSATQGGAGSSFSLLLNGHRYRVSNMTLSSGNGGAGADSAAFPADPEAVGGDGGAGGSVSVRIRNAQLTGTLSITPGAGGASGANASNGANGEILNKFEKCDIISSFLAPASYASRGCSISPGATQPDGGLQAGDYTSF